MRAAAEIGTFGNLETGSVQKEQNGGIAAAVSFAGRRSEQLEE
ncbi:hypothetical protein [Paenibacillus chitinolyticus]|nr:hypothetical protein [Paenibacillus chitinolyticus]